MCTKPTELWCKQTAAVQSTLPNTFVKRGIIEFKPNILMWANWSIHAGLYCTLTQTHTLTHLTLTTTHTHTNRILVNPKHSIQLKFRHVPLIEGFALLFMGPSLEYGCFITISLVLVGAFFPLHYIVLPALLWNAKDCDLNGFWVLLIHRRHISHTKVAPKGQANSTKRRGSLKSQASLKYHGGDLLMEWFWLVCTDGPWSSVMGSGCWKTG